MSSTRGQKERHGSGPPVATMRYMPLADIFVGAIVCLLILIIVARQTREQADQIPQADFIYKCARTSQGLSLQARQKKNKKAINKKLSLEKFENKIRRLSHPDRLSVRLLVLVTEQDSEICRKKIRKVIEKLNRLYETPDQKSRPSAFLLFDLAAL